METTFKELVLSVVMTTQVRKQSNSKKKPQKKQSSLAIYSENSYMKLSDFFLHSTL